MSQSERWTDKETEVLVNSWAPLYRARSSVDWSPVVSAVNSYRATTAGLNSPRTHLQCKDRVKYLKRVYMKGLEGPRLEWPFFSVLHAVWADEVGDHAAGAVVGRVPSAGDAERGGGAAASVDVRDGSFVHENCRRRRRGVAFAVNSSRTADGVGSERVHKKCGGRVKRLKRLCDIYEKKHGAVFDADMGEECRGASVDEEAHVGEPAAATLPNLSAARSGDAEVIMKLAQELCGSVTKLGQEVCRSVTKLGQEVCGAVTKLGAYTRTSG